MVASHGGTARRTTAACKEADPVTGECTPSEVRQTQDPTSTCCQTSEKPRCRGAVLPPRAHHICSAPVCKRYDKYVTVGNPAVLFTPSTRCRMTMLCIGGHNQIASHVVCLSVILCSSSSCMLHESLPRVDQRDRGRACANSARLRCAPSRRSGIGFRLTYIQLGEHFRGRLRRAFSSRALISGDHVLSFS